MKLTFWPSNNNNYRFTTLGRPVINVYTAWLCIVHTYINATLFLNLCAYYFFCHGFSFYDDPINSCITPFNSIHALRWTFISKSCYPELTSCYGCLCSCKHAPPPPQTPLKLQTPPKPHQQTIHPSQTKPKTFVTPMYFVCMAMDAVGWGDYSYNISKVRWYKMSASTPPPSPSGRKPWGENYKH